MKPLVRIKVIGYNLDVLINKIHSNQVECFDISRVQHNEVLFSIHIKHYKKIKPLLKNYEYQIKYLGIANFKKWCLKNLAIFLVAPFAIMMSAFSTKFTWNIKIYGADDKLDNAVIEILKENGVWVGGFLPNDNKNIEKILLEKLPSVAQVSCITRGTTIIINISEKLVYTPKIYEPICAKFNGIITSFSLISGTMVVKVGDFVSEGDVLVEPFTYDKQGNKVDVEPIAEIRAKAYVVGSTKLASSSVILARTGKQHTIKTITLFGKNLFSKKLAKPLALYETSVYNEYISSVLPIVKTTTTYYELDYKVIEHDLVAEQPQIEEESKRLAYDNLPTNSHILAEQTDSVIINDVLYSTTTLTISTIIS